MDTSYSWQQLNFAPLRRKALGASLGLALSVLGGCDEGASKQGEKRPDKQEESGKKPTDKKKGEDKQESEKASPGKPEKSEKKKPESEKSPGNPGEEPTQEESSEATSSTGEPDSSSTKEPDTDNKDTTKEEKPTGEEKIPCEGDSPRVVLDTQFGKVIVDLDGKRAPITVKNFSQYVNDKFFDDTIFHRIIKTFVVQGGGHGLDGKLKKTRPPIKLEIHPELRHVAGTISMARTQEKNSANSQFFLCTTATGCKSLDDQYAAFGQTVEGMDVITKLAAVKTNGSPNDKPLENVVLKSAYCIKRK